MKLFNVGARRPAIDGARLSAANALVNSTLARHGLLPGADTQSTSSLPLMDSLLAQVTNRSGPQSAPVRRDLPGGATFRQDTYTSPAGSRTYRTYVPAKMAEGGVTGVLMMLHGCTQNPEDFASGTAMNTLAEEHGFVVIYPAQSRGDNAQSCWNWFSRGDQQRGRGEPAILAGLATQIASEHGIDRDRTFVAGLSAGGAMAAILGEAYPDVFAAVGIHSGLPVGAAKDVASAFAAMRGTILDAPLRSGDGPKVRSIIFHGTADATVHPENSKRIMRRVLDGGSHQTIETRETGTDKGRNYTRLVVSNATGADLAEHWQIEGQGHAWSGGSATGTYTDPKGPNASVEMIRFFFDNTDEVY